MAQQPTTSQTTKVHLGGWVRALLGAAMLGVLVAYTLTRILDLGAAVFPGDWLVLLLVEAMLCAFLLSWHQLRIEGSALVIQWFPYFTRRVPRDELESVAEATADPWQTGSGARMIGSGALTPMQSGTTAVLLTFVSQKFLVTLNDDDETAEFIARLQHSLPRP
ncbi:hypothetical protein JD292_08490 [Leucobacter sp. CSA2]|uniref:Uncharacterized protein n=1 Tax=Leucobacter edaphi TaxID=2796472 RepID=A0A934QEW1_9MICO|nr:hypothetical protein [Leucobacter edaphi]MBK0422112.1 hypothetical protein [Leucobacter edaphi]